eukprot:symbB.v1.2.031128.t3/scaffold3574.1/size53885/2
MEVFSRSMGSMRRKAEVASGRPHSLALAGMVLAVLTLGRSLYSPCVRRLFRNVALPGIPDAVAPTYATCSDPDLVEHVSLVVTVKDTCGQFEELMSHLATMFPKGSNPNEPGEGRRSSKISPYRTFIHMCRLLLFIWLPLAAAFQRARPFSPALQDAVLIAASSDHEATVTTTTSTSVEIIPVASLTTTTLEEPATTETTQALATSTNAIATTTVSPSEGKAANVSNASNITDVVKVFSDIIGNVTNQSQAGNISKTPEAGAGNNTAAASTSEGKAANVSNASNVPDVVARSGCYFVVEIIPVASLTTTTLEEPATTETTKALATSTSAIATTTVSPSEGKAANVSNASNITDVVKVFSDIIGNVTNQSQAGNISKTPEAGAGNTTAAASASEGKAANVTNASNVPDVVQKVVKATSAVAGIISGNNSNESVAKVIAKAVGKNESEMTNLTNVSIKNSTDPMEAVNDVVGAAKSISDVAQAIWNKNASSNGTNATSVAHAAEEVAAAAKSVSDVATAIWGGHGNASVASAAHAASTAASAADAIASAIWGGVKNTTLNESSNVKNATSNTSSAVNKTVVTIVAPTTVTTTMSTTSMVPTFMAPTEVHVVIDVTNLSPEKYLSEGLSSALDPVAHQATTAFAGAAIVNTITVEKCLASASLRVEQEMAGALDGVLQKAVAFNCSGAGPLAEFELATGVKLTEAFKQATEKLQGGCVLRLSPHSANQLAQEALQNQLEKIGDQQATIQALRDQVRPRENLTKSVQSAVESSATASKKDNLPSRLSHLLPLVTANITQQMNATEKQLSAWLGEKFDLLCHATEMRMQKLNKDARSFQQKMILQAGRPSLDELRLQMGMANATLTSSMHMLHQLEQRAKEADLAEGAVGPAHLEADQAKATLDYYSRLSMNRSAEAAQMLKSQHADPIRVAQLTAESLNASKTAGHWAAAEIEARLRMKDFMEKEASNATQEYLLSEALQEKLEAIAGASQGAIEAVQKQEQSARRLLRGLNLTVPEYDVIHNGSVALLQTITKFGHDGPGNVTISVQIQSRNKTEIFETIQALRMHLKETLGEEAAVHVHVRSMENATGGIFRVNALLPSAGPTEVSKLADVTAQAIRDVLGKVVSQVDEVEVDGKDMQSPPEEGLPIRAAKLPSDEETPNPSKPGHPWWHLVGPLGCLLLAVLAVLLICTNGVRAERG